MKPNKAKNNGSARCSYVALQQIFFLSPSFLNKAICLYNHVADRAAVALAEYWVWLPASPWWLTVIHNSTCNWPLSSRCAGSAHANMRAKHSHTCKCGHGGTRLYQHSGHRNRCICEFSCSYIVRPCLQRKERKKASSVAGYAYKRLRQEDCVM